MKKFIWVLVIVSWSLVIVLPKAGEAVLARGMTAAGVTINNTQGVAAQQYPNIIADGAGNTIVAWHDYKSGIAALYAQSYDGSGNARWSPAAGVPICTVTNFFGTMIALDSNALAFHMVSDGSGGAIIAWNDYRTDGTTSHVYAQRINSSGVVQWTANGKLVCDAANGQSLNSMDIDGSGGALLAWTDLRNFVNGSDIYVQRIGGSDGASQWTINGVQVYDNTALGVGANRPSIINNGGGAIVTWDDNRASPSYYGIYAQKLNANGGAVAWAANGVAVQVNDTGSAVNPKIVTDNSGGAVIAWWDERVNPGASQYDVFSQRINASGEKVWTTQGVTLCLQSDYSDNSVDMAIVTDTVNGAIVSWPDMRNVGGGYRIYAQRVVANGGVSWTADGVAVNTLLNNDSSTRPRMVADGSGGAYIATSNYGSGGTLDIRVHRINSSGETPVGWADGKAVNDTATVDERNPRVAYDTINGVVVVVWMNQANDTRGDIWGQALSSGGAYGWGTTTGKELIATTGAATQRYPAVASDGAGGGVTVWEDQRSVDYYQIYSQRFNSSGSVLWAADGVRLDNTVQDNLRPSVCRTSDGYYIMAWTSGSTIYVQKVNSDGTAQWAAGGVAVASTFGSGFYYPVVASDGAGGVLLAYSVGVSGAVTKTSAKLGDRLWASAYLSDISEGELPDLNGILYAKGDGGGGGGGAGTFRVYYKRIASDGSIVTPYGGAVQNATSLGVLATTYHDAVNGEIQLWPSIAKVDSTNVVITWDDRRTVGSAAWYIYAQKVLIADGMRQWTDDAVAVTSPGGTVATYYPWIGSNGTDGTAVVAWMQSATNAAGYNYNILANKLSSAGALNWSSGINVAADGTLDEIRPKVAVDSSGNSFFVWQEGTWTSADTLNASTLHPNAPTMSNGAIYSQLVDSSGALSGAKFQVSSSAVNLNYEAPDVTTTSTAGTDIVVYDADIYAQSVTGVSVAVTPTAPTGFSGTAQSSSSILWSWTDNANNETGFRLVNSQTNSIVATIATANTTSYSETGLSPNTAYQRTIAAYTDANSSTPTAVTVYTLASIPDEMAATAAETSLAITWAVGDGTTYKMERAAASTGPWTTLSSTLTSKSYSDTGLTAGTTYWYRCSSANADGVWSAASEPYSFTTSTSGVTRQSPTIGGTKSSGTGLAIASNDYMSSTGDLKLNVSDLNTDGRITSVVVQVFNSSGVEVRRVESSEVLASYSVAALPAGTYRVLITATSIYGTTSVKELTGLKVSDKLQVTSALVAYPTAVLQSSILAQGHTAVQMAYQLSKNGNVSMVIYNTAGQVVYRGDYTPGSNGGSAGPNVASWDGYTVAGVKAARGLYIVQLIDRDGKALLGKVVVPVH